MRRPSFHGVLFTTTVIGALAPGLPLEPEFSALPGWWGMVVLHQPDFDPERPLATVFGSPPTTGTSGGTVHYATAGLDGEGTVYANPDEG